jgi:mannosyltransferase OCH1-like enzyme
VDTFRYALMHHYGGFYLDTDIEFARSLEPLRHFAPALLFGVPHRPSIFVNNAPLVSRPGHPFWLSVLEGVCRTGSVLGQVTTSWSATLATAGPLLLSMAYQRWEGTGADAVVVMPHFCFTPVTAEDHDMAFGLHRTDKTWGSNTGVVSDGLRLGIVVGLGGAAALVATALMGRANTHDDHNSQDDSRDREGQEGRPVITGPLE